MKSLLLDSAALGGVALIGWGAWLLHPGVLAMAAGAVIVIGALWVAANGPRHPPTPGR